jgi:hypothetical protein
MLTSASARTVVLAVALLLPVLESAVVELTVAVFEIVVPSAVSGLTWTTRMKVAVVPLASEPVVHVTVPVDPTAGVVHVQSVGAAIDWNVVCAGSGSVIVTLAAALGPALLTVMVYVKGLPGVTGSGASVLVMLRSA